MSISQNVPDWKKSGLRFFALSFALRREFGTTVRKVSLDPGFSCPNLDSGGCIFCNVKSFSPSRRYAAGSIRDQLEEGIARLKNRYRANRFLAYLQPSTNTYARPDRIRLACEEAIDHPEVVGLLLGTRPDCLGEEVLDLLADIASKTYFQLEIGLQSANDDLLRFLNRGHTFADFLEAVERASKRNLRIGVHLMLGLPGESDLDRRDLAQWMGRLKVHAVKLHNLYVVKETKLAELWKKGEIFLPSLDKYSEIVANFLERLSPEIVIDRLSGESPLEYLLAPEWSQSSIKARLAIESLMESRDSWQGKLWQQEF